MMLEMRPDIEHREYQRLVEMWLMNQIGSESFERKVQAKKGFWD